MIEVGRYERDLRASVARLIENALDWEHLPHLHDSSFSAISLHQADEDGWTADAVLPGGTPVLLQLTLDPDRLGWVTVTSRDGTAIARIESRTWPIGEHGCHVSVRFFVNAETAGAHPGIGEYYQMLYSRLYDEDEAMMMARAEAIREGAARLARRRTVTLSDGTDVEVPHACPHLGLPIDTDPDEAGILTCPWHGYRFDARTGACISGASCSWTVHT
jgi:nitrite reductase/ring-hydroxylating ferredoxin subunit